MKKIITKILIVIFCFSLMATTSYANIDGNSRGVSSGNLIIDKTAEAVGNGQYKITLDVKGDLKEIPPKPADIVLVIDKSNSMEDKIRQVRAAVNNFIDNILGAYGETTRISVVTFSGPNDFYTRANNEKNSQIVHDFSNDINSLKSKINRISLTGGTNTESGIWRAGQKLDESKNARPDASRYVVFFTDGLPTASHGSRATRDYQDKHFRAAQKMYNEIIGGIGTLGGIGSSPNAETVNPIPVGKHSDAKFYTLGLFTRATTSDKNMAIKFLKTIQNVIDPEAFKDKYYTQNTEAINGMFNEIAEEIKGSISQTIANEVEITDVVTKEFDIVDGSFEITGDVDSNSIVTEVIKGDPTDKVNFKIGNVGKNGVKITFLITLKDPYMSKAGVPTNEKAEINWKDPLTEAPNSAIFPVPTVDIFPMKGKITIQKEIVSSENISYDENDTFSVLLNGGKGNESYNVDLKSGEANKIELDFYLKDINSDVSKNLDLNYITIGEFSIKEKLPMNYRLQKISVSTDGGSTFKDFNSAEECKFLLDKDNSNVVIKIVNEVYNDSYWYDDEVKNNIFHFNPTE
ncbi:MAG: VWA domain-containing protein [Clostridium septicum]|uniref:vWA domain-containing protein n=1 Tax=Clostridium septicum TaxID=1504 RepID=UPI00258323BD|nr:vWA domain-containing protein [Clostridium septicum]MDU1313715.1 VWA domain-containing protein [Clostridium septicum]